MIATIEDYELYFKKYFGFSLGEYKRPIKT